MEEQAHYCSKVEPSQDQQLTPDKVLGTATLTKNVQNTIVNLLVTQWIKQSQTAELQIASMWLAD